MAGSMNMYDMDEGGREATSFSACVRGECEAYGVGKNVGSIPLNTLF